MNLKQYAYLRGKDAALDASFNSGKLYGKVKLGDSAVFWKSGLRWCAVPLSRVRRAYRQVEPVYGKLCCGTAGFDIHRLILILTDGQTLELHIGDNELGDQVKLQAQRLFQALQDAHPEIQYGKE